jgi:CO dehydrogenase/acetyl-CoA synthase gamma subunit (corrinoid Fe-S protein)
LAHEKQMIEQEFADLYPLNEENLAEYLQDIDCCECGFSSCLAFAEALIGAKAKSEQCPELDGEMAAIIDALMELHLPAIPYNVMMESFSPGLIRVGDADDYSPVLVTGNFQETVRLLENILNACRVRAFLVLSDTKGYSVDNAVVEKRFTPFEILKVITETEVGSMVNHRNLVIPGLARHLCSQIKQATGWQVEVGPVSGLELPLFLVREGLAGTPQV